MASPGADPLNPPVGTDPGDTGNATEAVKERAEKLTDRVTETAGELKRQAESAAHELRDRAISAADEQKNAAAKRVEGVPNSRHPRLTSRSSAASQRTLGSRRLAWLHRGPPQHYLPKRNALAKGGSAERAAPPSSS
jgi:vacuolar-type H+-ATPase subunit H